MGERAIGIFDSGVGGLTVLKKIYDLMPNENIIYFADTLHVPYGNRPRVEILNYARNIIKFLLAHNVKIIVIACNTVCANCFYELTNEFKITLIDIIQSGVESALLATKNKSIGIIATESTIKRHSYEIKINKINKNIKSFSKACPLLVKLAENGEFKTKKTYDILKFYLKDFSKTNIDTLILGCTHYPLFYNHIKKILPSINLIDPADKLALITKNYLSIKKIFCKNNNNPETKFFVSGDIKKFKSVCEKILDKNLDLKNFFHVSL